MRLSLCCRSQRRNGEAPRRLAAAIARETRPASMRLSSSDAAFDFANLFCNLGVLEAVERAASVAGTKALYFLPCGGSRRRLMEMAPYPSHPPVVSAKLYCGPKGARKNTSWL